MTSLTNHSTHQNSFPSSRALISGILIGTATYALTKDKTTTTKQIGLSTIAAITALYGVYSYEQSAKGETVTKTSSKNEFQIQNCCKSGSSIDLFDEEMRVTTNASTTTSLGRGVPSKTASPNAKDPEGK